MLGEKREGERERWEMILREKERGDKGLKEEKKMQCRNEGGKKRRL